METITFSEALEKLGCSRKTILSLIDEGSLYAFKDGKSWKVSKQSLDNLIVTNTEYTKIKKRIKDSINSSIKKYSSLPDNKKFWKKQDIKIDWDSALKQATDRFYKEKTIDSAIYLQEVQRLYKRDDTNAYLDLLERGYVEC